MSDTSEVSTREHMLTQFMDTFQPCATALLEPHPGNPRRDCDDAALDELAASIRAVGLIEPLIVVRIEGEGRRYQVVAGHRRLEAAKRASLEIVPCIIKTLSLQQQLEIMLIENLQRKDLKPLEEAEAYRRLLKECGYTQEALAGKLGISQAQVANRLRLLRLPEAIRDDILREIISPSHALALVKLVPAGHGPSPLLKEALKNLGDKPAREAADHVDQTIVTHGRSLNPTDGEWARPPLFDVTQECATCPHAHTIQYYRQEIRRCASPKCWDRKQAPLMEAAAAAAKKRLQRKDGLHAATADAPSSPKPAKTPVWPKQPPQAPSIEGADLYMADALRQLGEDWRERLSEKAFVLPGFERYLSFDSGMESKGPTYRFVSYLPLEGLLAHFAQRATVGASHLPDGMGDCRLAVPEHGVRMRGDIRAEDLAKVPLEKAPRYGILTEQFETAGEALVIRLQHRHVHCWAGELVDPAPQCPVHYEVQIRPSGGGGHYRVEQMLVIPTDLRHIVIRGHGSATMARDVLPKLLKLCAQLPAHPTAAQEAA